MSNNIGINRVIVDGNFLVSKSAIINGTMNAGNIKTYGDVSSNSDSLNLIGRYLNLDYTFSNKNTKFGSKTMKYNAITGTGDQNSCLGYEALNNNTDGSFNNAIGHDSMFTNTTGHNNNAMGVNTLFSNINGSKNIAIGTNALYSNTSGNSNIGIGYYSLNSNTSGITNIAIGDYSLGNATNITDGIKYNIAIGCSSLYNNQNNENLTVGVSSLYNNTTGNKNIGIGNTTLLNNTLGSNNIAIGKSGLSSNISGNNNVALGVESLQNNTSGNSNVGIGYSVLNGNVSGNYNIGIGTNSLNMIQRGDNNIAIGYNTNATNTANTSTISIGYNVAPTDDNQIVIGNGGYNAYMNVSGFCVGAPYSTDSNYKSIINNTLKTTNDVFLNSNNIIIGNADSNVSTNGNNTNISSNSLSIISNIFNLSVPKFGMGTNNPTGKLHIYESYGSGDISKYIWNNYAPNLNGTIYAIDVDSNGNVYVGGSFANIETLTDVNNIAKWNSTSKAWEALGTTKGVSQTGTVYAIKVDASNNVYVGGRFDTAGGITVNNIAMWNGSWNTVGSGSNIGLVGSAGSSTNATVYCITLYNNKLYIGGTFSFVKGTLISLNNIVVWNIPTSLYSGLGTGVLGNQISSIAIYNDVLYASGNFTTITISTGTYTANNIASFNLTSNPNNYWNNLLNGLGTSTSYVNSIAIDTNGNLYAVGDFINDGNGNTVNRIAKWSNNSWSSITYDPGTGPVIGVNNEIRTIVIDSTNNIYIGGKFTTAGGVTVNNIALLNNTNNTWYWYNYSYNGIYGITNGTYPCRILNISKNNLYIGGDFTSAGGDATINYLTYIIYTNINNNAQSKGTLILEHGNSGGCSSIVFPSNKNKGGDYAYIQYRDNVSESYSNENGRLEIGTENETTQDAIILQKNGGYVGIGTIIPNYQLDVSGVINATSGINVDSYIRQNTPGNSFNLFNTNTGGLNIGGSGTVNIGSGSVNLCQNVSKRSVEIGADAANKAYIDFHSLDDRTNDYDVRLISIGGTGGATPANGGGRLSIIASKVGIGNENTTYNLDVSGTSYVSSNFICNGNVGVGTTSPSYKLHVTGGSMYFADFVGIRTAPDNTYGLKVSGSIYTDSNFYCNGPMRIYESTGTTPTITTGTLVLEHGNSGGISSIIFPSKTNRGGNDYGYIIYRDDVDDTTSNEQGRLEIGTENDAGSSGGLNDALILQKNGGYVGIGKKNPSSVLDVNGSVNAASYNATSDYRIKENVININESIYSDLFNNLRPVYYLNKNNNKNDFGFIAHEVQELYPELVDGDKDVEGKFQSLNYSGLIPLCVNEIKKLKEENRTLNEKVNNLEKEIQKIISMMSLNQ